MMKWKLKNEKYFKFPPGENTVKTTTKKITYVIKYREKFKLGFLGLPTSVS